MFTLCTSLVSVPYLDLNRGINFEEMFRECSSLESTADLNTTSGKKFARMFFPSGALKCISKINTLKSVYSIDMFNGASALVAPTSAEQAHIMSTPGVNWGNPNPCPVPKAFRMKVWTPTTPAFTVTGGAVTVEDNLDGSFDVSSYNPITWITSTNAIAATKVELIKTDTITNCEHMFHNWGDLADIAITGRQFSNVSNFGGMFQNCAALVDIDTTRIDVSPTATSINGMFSGCTALTDIDVSTWYTSNVTDMSGAFSGMANIEYLDLRDLSCAKVTDMNHLIDGDTKLKAIRVPGDMVTTGPSANMSNMFSN